MLKGLTIAVCGLALAAGGSLFAGTDITLASGVTLEPGKSALIPIALSRPAPLGGLVVRLTSADSSLVTVFPTFVRIDAGDTMPARQPRVFGVGFGVTAIAATALGTTTLQGDSQTVRVSASLIGPGSAEVKRSVTRNVHLALSSPAPEGLTLRLKSDNPSIAGVPTTIVVAAGATEVAIPVTGSATGSTGIHVSALGAIVQKDVNITVVAPDSILLPAGSTVALGATVPFPITLGSPAPTSGRTVIFTTDPAHVTISPSSVFIPEGSVTPAVQPQITAVDLGNTVISARATDYTDASTTVTVTATLTWVPSSVTVGDTSSPIRVVLALSASAPWGPPSAPWSAGFTAQLSSSNTSVAYVPSTVDFYPDGSSFSSRLIYIQPQGVGTATITAQALPWVQPVTLTITVGAGGGGTPASIGATGGTPQTAVVGTGFASPLFATVRDAGGQPVAGVTVQFQVPGTGPSGTFAGNVTTAVTDSLGAARSAGLTANTTPGSWVALASVSGVATPASFSLTNSQPAIPSISLASGVTTGPGRSTLFAVGLTSQALTTTTIILQSSDTSKATISPATVTIAPGATAPVSQPSVTGITFGDVSITASAPGFASASQQVKVAGILSFQPSSISIRSPGAQTLNLTLSDPAPAGGLTVGLQSSNSGAASVPASVSIAAGATSVPVPVTLGVSGVANITAHTSAPNVTDAAATVTVSTGADIMLATGIVVAPGEWATMPITLSRPAPEGGLVVSLSSADPSIVAINPTLVRIDAGQTAPARQPQVSGISFGAAAITVSAVGIPLTGDTQTVQVSASLIGPPTVQVQRTVTQNVTLALSSPTPAALTLTLASDDPSIVSVPATINLPVNSGAVSIPVTGVGAGTTIIHIGAPPNIAKKDIAVTVLAPAGITLPGGLTVPLGATAPFNITLGSPAGQSGVTVTLSSSDTTRMTISPATVSVAPGQTTPAVQPQVTAIDIGGPVITASASGYTTSSTTVGVTATLNWTPPAITISGNAVQTTILALSASAPWGTGFTAQLTSSNTNVAIVAPSVNFYPDGSAFTSIQVPIQPVGPGTATITASALPWVQPVTLNVTVGSGGGGTPASIAATGGTPQTTVAGTAFASPLIATVRDAGGQPVAGATVQFQVSLGTSTGSFVGGANTAVTDALGVARSATLIANGSPGAWTASATVAGVAAAATFSLTNSSPSPVTITLASGVTTGPGRSVPIAVTLSAPAPVGGVTITLGSTDTSKATISPAMVNIAGGATTPAAQPLVTGVNFGDVNISASAPSYTSATRQVKVVGTLVFQPSSISIHGAGPQPLNLTLSDPAPAGGLLVSLLSGNAGIASTPANVTIPAGATSVSVPVTGGTAGTVTIAAHASAPNVTDVSATVTVSTSTDISLATGVIVAPGEWATMEVRLAQPAPDGGVLVSLASADSSIVTVNPSLIRFNAGSTTPVRQPQVNGINYGAAAITASALGLPLTGDSQIVRVSASLIGPPSVQIQRGTTQSITLSLSSPTPAALVLTLSSDNSSIASVPPGINLSANTGGVAIPVTGVTAGTITIHIGALPNIATKDIAITVVGP